MDRADGKLRIAAINSSGSLADGSTASIACALPATSIASGTSSASTITRLAGATWRINRAAIIPLTPGSAS